METRQIDQELKLYPSYVGTFACDQLYFRSPLPRPFALVINTDGIRNHGEHWTAIYAPREGEPEYFDSFGFPPLIANVQRFLDVNCQKSWYYSSNSIQHPFSMSCGQYCIKFIKHRIQGKSFKSFISNFFEESSVNDTILEKM